MVWHYCSIQAILKIHVPRSNCPCQVETQQPWDVILNTACVILIDLVGQYLIPDAILLPFPIPQRMTTGNQPSLPQRYYDPHRIHDLLCCWEMGSICHLSPEWFDQVDSAKDNVHSGIWSENDRRAAFLAILIHIADPIHQSTGAYYILIAFTEVSPECASEMPWLIQY